MSVLMLFLPESPMIWIFIVAVIFLLFGGSKLPQLAKALGQSKKAFKEGIAEGDDDDHRLDKPAKDASTLSAVDDEQLFEEARRRARLRVGEGKND